MPSVSDLPFFGGHVALDFVNTAEERGHPEAVDVLVTAADLQRWGERYGLLEPGLPAESGAGTELGQALEARELLYAVLFARAHQQPVPDTQLARLAELAAAGYRAGVLRLQDDGHVGWAWSPEKLATVRHVVVTAGVELLRAESSSRLKQCPGDHCGWFFLDQTKAGNRRWCSMSECGQQAKDRRRRRRRPDGP